jgi:2-dehydro-3-deoxyphosphogluconate aldolase / (4S)-4-hydroxy-2-oxoglutarate aldolase
MSTVLSLRHTWLPRFQQQRYIAVIRVDNLALGWQMAKTAAAAGIELIEIAWHSQDAADLIKQLQQTLPSCSIGTGTILTLPELTAAVAAGAEFLFMPHTNPSLIDAAVSHGVAVIPGACTPSEIVTAWQAGATAVKVFPIQAMGGAPYLKHLQAPLGHIPLIPTGGVTLTNAQEYLDTGAIAVGIGSDLFPATLVQAQDWQTIAGRLSERLSERLSKRPSEQQQE